MLTDVFNANSASSPTDGTKWRAVEMVTGSSFWHS